MDCNDCGTPCVSGGQVICDGMYSYDDRLICSNCMDNYWICEVCEDLIPDDLNHKHNCNEEK